MKLTNCMVAQSGGPTVAINASLAGVISQIQQSKEYDICYGAVHGVLGILDENYLNLTELMKSSDDSIERLKLSPAMFLGSCRYKLPHYKDNNSPYIFIFHQFEQLNIKTFFYIGGNDSMDTVLKLSEYGKMIHSDVRIIGIPKTIDNDLCITDHTPGFGSAAKYIAASLLEIAHDTFIYPVKSVTIVEIMGRDAGWLTAASALARNSYNTAPHLIYLPEVNFNKNQFLEDVRSLLQIRNNVIIAVSEGIHDEEGNYITASSTSIDNFGHQQLSGAGKALEYMVKENIDVKVRSVEINVLQRCAAHLASLTDIEESFAQGQKAVSLSIDGISGSMVILKRLSNQPYQVAYDYAPISSIANEAKSVPIEWINTRGNDITQELTEYLSPLIQGEVPLTYANGLPAYMPIPHLNTES